MSRIKNNTRSISASVIAVAGVTLDSAADHHNRLTLKAVGVSSHEWQHGIRAYQTWLSVLV